MIARGFTLIELMITLAIVAILSAIAVPQYSDYIRRGNLVDATNTLSDARVRMEQFYADNRTYAGAGTGGCGITIVKPEKFTATCAVTNGGQGYLVTSTGDASTIVTGFAYSIDQANTRTTISWGSSWGAVPAYGATRWLIKKG